jgi:hypothetical protein
MEPLPARSRPQALLRVFVGVAAADSGEEFWRFLDDLKRAVQRQVGPFVRFSISPNAETSYPPLPSPAELQEELRSSAVFVALVTAAYLESLWVREEAADFAVAHRQRGLGQTGRVIAVLWAGGNMVRDNPPEELGDYRWFEPADFGTPTDGFPGALQRNELSGYEEALGALATIIADALRTEPQPNARQDARRQAAASAPSRDRPESRAAPRGQQGLWALEMTHAFAMAFHLGRLGPREPAAWRGWEQEFSHLRFQTEYVFNRPAQDYLRGGHDPFNVDSETNVRLLSEAATRARDLTHDALLALSTVLGKLAQNASEDASHHLTQMLGRSWAEVEKLITEARVRPGNPRDVDDLVSRISNPRFLETARPHLGTMSRVFAEFPTSLASSEDFPTYLHGLTGLWIRVAISATKQPPEPPIAGLTVSRPAFDWFNRYFTKVEIQPTGESDTGDEIQFASDRRSYIDIVRQLQEVYVPALFDELNRRGGASPERTPPLRPRPGSPPRSAA